MAAEGEQGGEEGLRERKRRETRQRIIEASLRLFGRNGYETTTLDAIAAEAGISRRTFFHYFKTKDDILLSLQSGLGDQLAAAIAAQPKAKRPLVALHDAMLSLTAPYSPEELLALDRLMRSSETVQARKQANYVRDEAIVFAALVAHWPDEAEAVMRLLASFAINTVRLSIDTFNRENGQRPIGQLLEESFKALNQLAQQPWPNTPHDGSID